jgi:hypothetical protein
MIIDPIHIIFNKVKHFILLFPLNGLNSRNDLTEFIFTVYTVENGIKVIVIFGLK